MSPCSQHLPNKVWLNCSELGVSGQSVMSVIATSPDPGEEAWVTEDTVTEENIEVEEAEVTPSPASLLYVEFRKYVSMIFGEHKN